MFVYSERSHSFPAVHLTLRLVTQHKSSNKKSMKSKVYQNASMTFDLNITSAAPQVDFGPSELLLQGEHERKVSCQFRSFWSKYHCWDRGQRSYTWVWCEMAWKEGDEGCISGDGRGVIFQHHLCPWAQQEYCTPVCWPTYHTFCFGKRQAVWWKREAKMKTSLETFDTDGWPSAIDGGKIHMI